MQRLPFLRFAIILLLSASSVAADVRYVNVNNTAPAWPYTDWSTAATNIQVAIDAAAPGDLVLVTNGIYQTGGRVVSGVTNAGMVSGEVTNRVAITKVMTVRSVNGPAQTIIVGRLSNDTNYARCVFLTNDATLDGFTVTNGLYTCGGIWCASSSSTVTNCVIVGNIGGGAWSGTFINCLILRNSASISGGGACQSVLNNCLLAYNFAGGFGGGSGGGADSCTLTSCTVVSNYAPAGGGGVINSTLYNCIVYDNHAGFSSLGDNYYSCTLIYCCAIPLPTDGYSFNNITNDPVFVNPTGGDFHLQPWSRCINAGENYFLFTITTDLDGYPRIRGGTVDMGAYEFQAQVTGLFTDWLQQYGLPTNGLADAVDSDNDGMVNWQEWITGTNPTNAQSVLKLPAPDLSNSNGVVISWPSVSNRIYSIQRNADLTAPFSTLQDSIMGQGGSMSYTDTTATASAPLFYRVGVQ